MYRRSENVKHLHKNIIMINNQHWKCILFDTLKSTTNDKPFNSFRVIFFLLLLLPLNCTYSDEWREEEKKIKRNNILLLVRRFDHFLMNCFNTNSTLNMCNCTQKHIVNGSLLKTNLVFFSSLEPNKKQFSSFLTHAKMPIISGMNYYLEGFNSCNRKKFNENNNNLEKNTQRRETKSRLMHLIWRKYTLSGYSGQ